MALGDETAEKVLQEEQIMNRRGEIATLTVVAIAAVALFLGTLAPSLNPFHGLFGGQQSAANQKASWTRQDEIQKPVLLSSAGGVPIAVGTQVERHYNTGVDERPVKLTLGQRIGRFFAGLGTWGLIFIVVSLVFFGGTPIVWLFRKYTVMKHAFKNTVSAIRETDEETYAKLKPKLQAKHDKRDRQLIDKLKAELQ